MVVAMASPARRENYGSRAVQISAQGRTQAWLPRGTQQRALGCAPAAEILYISTCLGRLLRRQITGFAGIAGQIEKPRVVAVQLIDEFTGAIAEAQQSE